MHDIGRTQQEYLGESQEFHEYQPETYEYGHGEMHGETLGESFEAGFHETGAGESGAFEGGAFETGYETGGYEAGGFETFESYESQEAPIHEALEMELASELLEITNEDELDRFLGKLIRRVSRGIGRAINSPLGRALGGVLKPLASKLLPIAGRVAGTFFGGPVGGMVGGQLASMAGRAFGLELEGMSGEDAEFEVARRFVRLASSTVNNATAGPSSGNPRAIARTAFAAAARRHAPGLLGGNVLTQTLTPDRSRGIPRCSQLCRSPADKYSCRTHSKFQIPHSKLLASADRHEPLELRVHGKRGMVRGVERVENVAAVVAA